MDLAALKQALMKPGLGQVCELDEGEHEITETILVQRNDVVVRGALSGRTLIRRGILGENPFQGALIAFVDRENVALESIAIEGARFNYEGSDRRHPVNPDPASLDFIRMSGGSSIEGYLPEHCHPCVEADVFAAGCRNLRITDVSIKDSITIGLAIGPGCRDVVIDKFSSSAAGQMGLWIGGAFPTRVPLPLSAEQEKRLPQKILVQRSSVKGAGAAGIAIEARSAVFHDVTLADNHRDFPFNDSGGQFIIDYKSENIRLEDCTVRGESYQRRPVMKFDPDTERWKAIEVEFAAVGIEASGRNLTFVNLVVTGSAREAVHFNGASHVRLEGVRTLLSDNHRAARRSGSAWATSSLQDISITTTVEQSVVGSSAHHYVFDGICVEGGVLVWSNGSVPEFRLDGLQSRRCDFGARTPAQAIVAGLGTDGLTTRGAGWRIEP